MKCQYCGAAEQQEEGKLQWECGSWRQNGGHYRSTECRDREIANLREVLVAAKAALKFIVVPEDTGFAFVATEQLKARESLIAAIEKASI